MSHKAQEVEISIPLRRRASLVKVLPRSKVQKKNLMFVGRSVPQTKSEGNTVLVPAAKYIPSSRCLYMDLTVKHPDLLHTHSQESISPSVHFSNLSLSNRSSKTGLSQSLRALLISKCQGPFTAVGCHSSETV
ncbi:hypothetical protein FRX31_011786, partial [Thalictrum thalictroides]